MSISAVFRHYEAEALEVHRQCDLCGIPREHHGELLSMSQRAALLAEAFRALKEQHGSK